GTTEMSSLSLTTLFRSGRDGKPRSTPGAKPICLRRESDYETASEIAEEASRSQPCQRSCKPPSLSSSSAARALSAGTWSGRLPRSEEHTSELQSRENLV